jgi:hypothetical protein
MGATSTPKKKKTPSSVTKKAHKTRSPPAKPKPKPKASKKPPSAPEEALAISLFMPANQDAERARLARARPLSASGLEKLLKQDAQYAVKLIELQESPLIYEADLASLLKRQEIRQLVLTQSEQGWEVQALPVWKGNFLTLVSLKKEKRRYKDLDRLISTITTHGPLPPTILIGE